MAKLDNDGDQSLAVMQEAIEACVLMLAPITPHICHHLWSTLGKQGLVIDAHWPAVDESALKQDSIEMVVQVNGKVRAKLQVATDASQDAIKAMALEHESVIKFTEGKNIAKVIVVPGKLVSVVAK